jgi:hypothetical protein
MKFSVVKMRTVDASGFVFGELDSLPGCSQVVISHSVFSVSPFKGEGSGKRAHAERLGHMRQLGWDYALCTVNMNNAAQLAILTRFNWKKLDEFNSDKTKHIVGLFGKHLRDEDLMITRGSNLL